ncbi:MAG TPA: hypothetical protein PKH07_01330 [bacterium]|nr:hypothetical protein [bacterium]
MADPYKDKLKVSAIYSAKRSVAACFVAILDLRMEDRGLQLIVPQSRAVRQGEVIEIISTSEAGAKPGGTVQTASYFGFAEVQCSGMILVGDQVRLGGETIARVAGFDETHAPNHINVVLSMDPARTGAEMCLAIEQEIEFAFKEV